MCRYIQQRKLQIVPCAAGRTVAADILPVAEAQQRSGQRIELYTFIGSSPIRQWAEAWDLEFLLKTSREAIALGVKEGLQTAFVTEDTVRSSPFNLDRLFRNAVEHGASRLVLCDTVGHATPEGARALVRWTRGLLQHLGAPAYEIDWRSHRPRAARASPAIAAGAGRAGARQAWGGGGWAAPPWTSSCST
jgi:2-isopropylmalate synthase